MTKEVDPMLRGVIPYLSINGAGDASAFYQKAFGAEEVQRMPADDGKRLMHCRLVINGGTVMMGDSFPEHGYEFQPSHSFTMQLVVADIDAWWRRAVDAGCEITTPLQLMFWGDRYGALKDPFGVHWAMNQPAENA